MTVIHFIIFHVGLATGWWHAYYPSLFAQGSIQPFLIGTIRASDPVLGPNGSTDSALGFPRGASSASGSVCGTGSGW